MHRRGYLVLCGSLFTAGCTTAGTGGQSPTKTEADSSPDTADCSDATLAVSLTALTSGDTITVEGKVLNTPAPPLRGFIIERACPDSRRDITIPLDSTGPYRYEFEYGHHGIEDYGFWLEGCSAQPTPESTITC